MISRRQFSKAVSAGAAGIALASVRTSCADHHEKLFDISLAQWSLHRALKGGKMDNLDFAAHTKKEYGISAVEYVNQFFKDKAEDKKYIADMKTRAAGEGVTNVLIMVDGEGKLGDANLAARAKAVENHFQWVAAAKELGCHSIRVNAASSGSYDDQVYRAADGLRALTEFAADHDINVIVENHGGLSSNGAWLAKVIQTVDHGRCPGRDVGADLNDRDRGDRVRFSRAVAGRRLGDCQQRTTGLADRGLVWGHDGLIHRNSVVIQPSWGLSGKSLRNAKRPPSRVASSQ